MSVVTTTLASGTGTGLAVQVYQTPTGTATVIKSAVFTNTTLGSLTFTVYANDGSASRTLIFTKTVTAGSNYAATELSNVILKQNYTFIINAATGIDYWVSGVEIS